MLSELRAKRSREPEDTARPTAPAGLEGFPLDTPMRQTRGQEMESVGFSRQPEERMIRRASAEVESAKMEE